MTPLIYFLLGFASSALAGEPAKPVTLNFMIAENGKVLASPRMTLLFGKEGQITTGSGSGKTTYSIRILPEQKADDMVQLDMTVSKIIDGHDEVLNESRVVTMLNAPAFMEKHTDGQPTLKVTVVPTL